LFKDDAASNLDRNGRASRGFLGDSCHRVVNGVVVGVSNIVASSPSLPFEPSARQCCSGAVVVLLLFFFLFVVDFSPMLQQR
jgi:hypothetical protein